MKKAITKFISAVTSVSIVVASLLTGGAAVLAYGEATQENTPYTLENLDLTKSLIYGTNLNSWIVHDEALKFVTDENGNAIYTDNEYKNSGLYFARLTDSDPNNAMDLSVGTLVEATKSGYSANLYIGNYKLNNGELRNRNGALEVYHDFVFSLNEKTGNPVSVSQFYMRNIDNSDLATEAFEVYFSRELNTLTDEGNKVIDYTNSEGSADSLITLDTPVVANYMCVRITMGLKSDAQYADYSYPRIGEIAVFGDNNPDLGYTVINNKSGVDLSASMIAGNAVTYTDNNMASGTQSTYPDWLVTGFQGITDSNESTTPQVDVVKFNEGGSALNLGNKVDQVLDIVTSLTEKTGKQTEVSGVYLVHGMDEGSNRITYKYAVYISDTLENLASAESLVATYCNVNLNKTQYIEFAKPVTGAYMLVRIIMAQPVNGHGVSTGHATDYSFTRMAEIAVFGKATDAYTLSNTAPSNLSDSVIYNTSAQHSLVQTTANGNQTSAISGVAILTDGDVNGAVDYGYSSMDNNTAGAYLNRFHAWSVHKFLHNNASKLETYEDFIFDIREKYNGAVDISSFFIGTSAAETRALYKFELYASDSRDNLSSSGNLVATCSNINKSGSINIELAEKVTANYVMLRVIFCNEYKLGYQNWDCTRLCEFAVFGTEHTGYKVYADTDASDGLYKSYISGVDPVDFYIYDNGNKYSLTTGSTYLLSDSSAHGGMNLVYGSDDGVKGVYFSENVRRNLGEKLDVYADAVYKLNHYGNSVEINEIFIGENTNVSGEILSSYSYEIFVSDKLDNLGAEETCVATVVNPTAASKNLVKFENPVSAKYIMFRVTMGTQLNARSSWSADMTYARIAEFAVFGEESVIAGDVNNDDVVDIRDLVSFKKYLALTGNNFVEKAADLDEDGAEIGTLDMVALRKYLLAVSRIRPDTYVTDGELTQKMIDVSRVNTGNRVRLGNKLAAFKQGGSFTIAFLGGSCTAGSGASEEQYRYVNRVVEWLRETYPKSTFTLVNAGIGATGSFTGVHRLYQDVLSKNPDLVFVEYSVNDNKNDPSCFEAYESILRTVWKYETQPAIITLGFVNQFMQSTQSAHLEISKHYDIPMISYGDVVRMLIADGTLTWEDVSPDSVHPSDLGHKIIAQLIASYLEDAAVWSTAVKATNKTESDFTYKFANAYYEDGTILTVLNDETNKLAGFDGYYTINSGFVANNDSSFANGYWEGAEGSEITFTVTAKSIGIIYNIRTDHSLQDGIAINYGCLEITVDGVTDTIRPYCNSGAAFGGETDYCNSYAIANFDEVGTHTVTVKAVGGYGSIRAFTVANGAQ